MPLTQLGNKKYYLGIFFKANWFKAEQYCRFHGMHLASINKEVEQKDLEEHIESFGMGHEHFWTSGTDQAEEGKFFWMSTGTPVSPTTSDTRTERRSTAWNSGTEMERVYGGTTPPVRLRPFSCARCKQNGGEEWLRVKMLPPLPEKKEGNSCPPDKKGGTVSAPLKKEGAVRLRPLPPHERLTSDPVFTHEVQIIL